MKSNVYYGVYDTKNKEQCVGIFLGARSVAKYIGNTPGSIRSSISRGNLARYRYEIKKVGEKNSNNMRNK